MKKIKIIRRNFVVAFFAIAQAVVFSWFTAPEALDLIRHPSLNHLTEMYTWLYLSSAMLLFWGLGLFSDTCKAYGQHRRYKAGLLTDYKV